MPNQVKAFAVKSPEGKLSPKYIGNTKELLIALIEFEMNKWWPDLEKDGYTVVPVTITEELTPNN